jgi:hypothetical protein
MFSGGFPCTVSVLCSLPGQYRCTPREQKPCPKQSKKQESVSFRNAMMLFFFNVQSFVLNLVIVALCHLTIGQDKTGGQDRQRAHHGASSPLLCRLLTLSWARFLKGTSVSTISSKAKQDLHWTSDCPTQEPDKLSRWPREVTANKRRSQEDFLSYPYVDIQLASQAPTRVQHPKASTYDSWKRRADADAVGAQV